MAIAVHFQLNPPVVGVGKERHIKKKGHGETWKGSTSYWNCFEHYWACASGLSAVCMVITYSRVVNAIGRQMRDLVNLELARWRLTVHVDAVAEKIGRNSASKHQPIRFSLSVENKRADGTGRPNMSRETKFSGTNGDGKKIVSTGSADHEQD